MDVGLAHPARTAVRLAPTSSARRDGSTWKFPTRRDCRGLDRRDYRGARNMQEVTARTQNLQLANKTLEDVKMLRRIAQGRSGLSSRGAATFVSHASFRLPVR
jgi:hypothetical protein